MKKCDFLFILCMLLIVTPFALIEPVGQWFSSATASHPYLMAFAKFAILSTAGEMLGLRIKEGCYNRPGFGVIPRAVIWGILGVGIAMAMKTFSTGAPKLVESLGVSGVTDAMKGEFSWLKVLGAFSISVTMNTIFAPVFMTVLKITDTHILNCNGSTKALITPFNFGDALAGLNWKVQWGFVFKKTIPLFWYPAHTITFLLPAGFQVLFAAVLGIVLGVLLSVAANMSRSK